MDPAGEPDPTGMRAVLRALPDPGPMPQDLADRIKASLAAEQAARAEAPDQRASAQAPPVDLAAYRHRRRRTPLLAAAASIMAVAGVGVVTMTGMPSAVVAIVTGGGSHDASTAAVGAPEAAADTQVRSGQGLADSSTSGSSSPLSAGSVRLSASGREWSTDSLAVAAPGLLDGQTTTPETLTSPSLASTRSRPRAELRTAPPRSAWTAPVASRSISGPTVASRSLRSRPAAASEESRSSSPSAPAGSIITWSCRAR